MLDILSIMNTGGPRLLKKKYFLMASNDTENIFVCDN